MKTRYKAVVAFQDHEAGTEFEADLDAELERRALRRGQLRKVRTQAKKEEKTDA